MPRYTILPLVLLLLLAPLALRLRSAPAPRAQTPHVGPTLPGAKPGRPTLLTSGWRITPAGRAIPLPGDLPLRMTVTPDGHSLIVNTGGYHDHMVNVISLATGRLTQSINVGKDWAGLCLSPAGNAVYVSGGGPPTPIFLKGARQQNATPDQLDLFNKPVLRLPFAYGRLSPPTGLTVAGLDESERYVSGLAAGPDGALFVANMQNNALYKLSPADGATLGFTPVGASPMGLAVSPDGSIVAVSNEGGRSVTLLRADTLDLLATVPVGIHPNDIVYGKDGRLYVANAGSDTVSVIQGTLVTETISTSLDEGGKIGATPDALALAPDGARLYVANAGNNSVAVVDITRAGASQVLGLIPTAWYPTALAVSPNSRTLFVGTAKGLASRASIPPIGANPFTTLDGKRQYDYIGNILSGSVHIVPVPSQKALDAYTRQVLANTPTARSAYAGHDARAADTAFAAFGHITHVVYIIRENRSYDQVMGDMTQGNGDPTLTLFGQRVTPNAHALARRTVLLDNLYTSGEVSEDGHQWCDSAYATDFIEKSWPAHYGERGEADADERVTASPAGYLWDACRAHHLSYYSYGETSRSKASPAAPPAPQGDPGHGALAGHLSAVWAAIPFGQHDTARARVFLDDLHHAEQTGQWPALTIMSLGEDHTEGLKAGAYTPIAHVAANDYALGQIIDGISHSPFWKSTAVFVIEDDAQNGPDHVDAHRTVGLLLSPYARRGIVDSTFYTTQSYVRTLELILHLPPLTQYDQAATPCFAAFTDQPDFAPYSAITPRVSTEARNPATGPGARASARLDLSAPDRADPDALNAILWHALRPGVPLPAPVRSARRLH